MRHQKIFLIKCENWIVFYQICPVDRAFHYCFSPLLKKTNTHTVLIEWRAMGVDQIKRKGRGKIRAVAFVSLSSRRRCREAKVDPTAWVDARGQIQPHDDDERWAARSSLNYFHCPTCPHTLPVCCLLPKLIRSAFHVWRKKYFSHVCHDSLFMYFFFFFWTDYSCTSNIDYSYIKTSLNVNFFTKKFKCELLLFLKARKL